MPPICGTERGRAALAAVAADQVRYHPGRSGPALGYTWSEGAGGQMFPAFREALEQLDDAHLITTAEHRLPAQRGHRVQLTTVGRDVLA